jgi:hypothetical protein
MKSPRNSPPWDDALENERRSLLSRLVAGFAHELNNPLSVLMGQASLLRRAMAEGPLAARADRIAEAGERCARIVRSLVSLADPPGAPALVDLDRVVRETLELLAHGLRSRSIDVRFEPAAPLPALAEPRSLRELVAHLVLCAEEALEEAPAPRILVVKTGFAAEGGRLELRVSLSGGLGWETAETEPRRVALTRALAEALNGALEAGPEGGRTHTMAVRIPAGGPLPAPAPPSARKRRILVLAGSDEFARSLEDVLSEGGHRVVSRAGVHLEGAIPEDGFDVLVADGDVSGLDLVSWVSSGDAARRLVVLAGAALPERISTLLHSAGVKVLRKPIHPSELLDVISRLSP